MTVRCTNIHEESQISESAFSNNQTPRSGADIEVIHYQGLLTIGPDCTFDASTASTGDSMVLTDTS